MTHLRSGKPFPALALILVAYSPALLAQAVQSLYSPVILVHASLATRTDPATRPIQMREDGSEYMRINSVGGDLSDCQLVTNGNLHCVHRLTQRRLDHEPGLQDRVERQGQGDPADDECRCVRGTEVAAVIGR